MPLVLALLFAPLAGCDSTGGGDDDSGERSEPTSGVLNVDVSPDSADVVVTGPGDFSSSFTGNQLLDELEPGSYTADATHEDFGDAIGTINVVAGERSRLSMSLDRNQEGPASEEVGALNVSVEPSAAEVTIRGPDDYRAEFTGSQFLAALKPGLYELSASAPGFHDAEGRINVERGKTALMSLSLVAGDSIVETPSAFFLDGDSGMRALDEENLQAGNFVFHAWLQDLPDGVSPDEVTDEGAGNPGEPLPAEQTEHAPSFTQNLAVGWVGYKGPTGEVRPVIGADVRWEIDQQWDGRVNSMQFGTSDDNHVGIDLGISDDQADTSTNNGKIDSQNLPLFAEANPLYNESGIGTPFLDGLTWVTLFSPDARAAGRIVAVATIDGQEIGKEILYKHFASKPELTIDKTVDQELVNLLDGTATATWTVVVENDGAGPATNVELDDILASGQGTDYALGSLPAAATAEGDGFDQSFSLGAAGTDTDEVTLAFTATVSEPGTWCNKAQIPEYENDRQVWEPIELESKACFTALEPSVSIVKDFVAPDDVTSLGPSHTAEAGEAATLRVRVENTGTGSASGVAVEDVLSSGDAGAYQLLDGAPGTPNGNDGFTYEVGTLDAGDSETLLFDVSASADGEYCDTVNLSADPGTNLGIEEDTACLDVATPAVEITKDNESDSVLPGDSYASTVVVDNTGNATAEDVVIRDLLGFNSELDEWVTAVSSNLDGLAGTLDGHTITADTIEIPAGGSRTFSVVSRVPPGALAGTYCDTATAESSNAPTVEATDCIDVPPFSALQTQLFDLDDPICACSKVSFFSVLYLEAFSNEDVVDSEMTYSFGLPDPTNLEGQGSFELLSTKVYLDPSPTKDPTTGQVTSDASNPSAELQTPGDDYTTQNEAAFQVLTMAPDVVLQPGTAIYVAHVVEVPASSQGNNVYTTSYVWDTVGSEGGTNESRASETTTILPTCSVQSCTGKECGSDGCGGSCGSCGDSKTCNDGVCVTDFGCTHTIGFWQTHDGLGPQPDVVSQYLPQSLGTSGGADSLLVPDDVTASDVLDQDEYGDASNGITKLYAQLLGAKLNIAAGAAPSSIEDVVADADAFLADHDWTDWDDLSSAQQSTVEDWKDSLDAYNNGNLAAPHCDELE